MAKQIWKPGTVLYPLPVVMVSCGNIDSESNILTVAWCGTINSEPAKTYISIRPSRYSYDIIKFTREFVINLTTKELAFATDFCGVRSGSDIDKFSHLGLTKYRCPNVKAPAIEESPISIECKVDSIIPLGSHDMFIADVVSVLADEKYMNENGKFDFQASDPICYSHGEYYGLGEYIGKFGYSVEKKKK